MLLCCIKIMQQTLALIEEAQVGEMEATTTLAASTITILAISTTLIPIGETLMLVIDQICFVNTANELDMSKIGATNSMVIQPTQEIQEEEAKDLQQMYIPLRVMGTSVKKVLSRENKCQ